MPYVWDGWKNLNVDWQADIAGSLVVHEDITAKTINWEFVFTDSEVTAAETGGKVIAVNVDWTTMYLTAYPESA